MTTKAQPQRSRAIRRPNPLGEDSEHSADEAWWEVSVGDFDFMCVMILLRN